MNEWEQTVRKITLWTAIAGFFAGLIFLLTYRYCEQAGPVAAKSCIAAIISAAAGGIFACWPMFRLRDKKQTISIAAIVLGGGIRILTAFIGVVLVLVFMDISRGWFLGCFGLFYTVFMLTGSWMMVRLIQYRGFKENESEYEEFRNIACQHGSARRNYE